MTYSRQLAANLLLLLLANVSCVLASAPSKDFQSIIAAPTQVQLANTGAITLTLSLRRSNDTRQDPLPAKIRLWTTEGKFLIPNGSDVGQNIYSSPLDIDTPAVSQSVTILLGAATSYKSSMRVDVTTAEEDSKLLGSVVIALHRPAWIEFIGVSEQISADGKTTGKITFRVTDEQHKTIANMPFLLRGYGPNFFREVVVSATTNTEGLGTFIVPASAKSGHALLQIIGPGGVTAFVTPQFDVHYEDGEFHPEKPLTPGWWKKPRGIL